MYKIHRIDHYSMNKETHKLRMYAQNATHNQEYKLWNMKYSIVIHNCPPQGHLYVLHVAFPVSDV